MTLPLLLALASTLASAPLVGDAPAPRPPTTADAEPAPTIEPPDTRYVDDLLKDLPSVARERRTPGLLPVVLVEGLFAAWSTLAACYPEATGWTMVGVSPLSFMNLQPGDTFETAAVFASGTAGLGLWDALELRGERYSRGERFLLNLAGWNAVGVATEVTARFTRKRKRPSAVALGLGPRGNGAMLLLRGRF